MRRRSSNEALLYAVASRLTVLRERLVFLGGSVRGLLITDPGAVADRPTEDVDVIVEVASLSGYHALAEDLRRLGFSEDPARGGPICRFYCGELVLDVMPTERDILSFSNDWYPEALRSATEVSLSANDSGSLLIRLITAPCFLATKLFAFADRGAGDLEHHDLEDVIALVDGRHELLEEMAAAPRSLQTYVGETLSALLAAGLEDKLRWHLPHGSEGDERLPYLTTRLRRLARAPLFVHLGQDVNAPGEGPSAMVRFRAFEPDSGRLRPKTRGRAYALTAQCTPGSAVTWIHESLLCIEDSLGRRYLPDSAAMLAARAQAGVSAPPLETESINTAAMRWVYHLAHDAEGLRLLLPAEGKELIL